MGLSPLHFRAYSNIYTLLTKKHIDIDINIDYTNSEKPMLFKMSINSYNPHSIRASYKQSTKGQYIEKYNND